LVALGFELRPLGWLSRHSYCLSHSSSWLLFKRKLAPVSGALVHAGAPAACDIPALQSTTVTRTGRLYLTFKIVLTYM
jgi:hypothetical protein